MLRLLAVLLACLLFTGCESLFLGDTSVQLPPQQLAMPAADIEYEDLSGTMKYSSSSYRAFALAENASTNPRDVYMFEMLDYIEEPGTSHGYFVYAYQILRNDNCFAAYDRAYTRYLEEKSVYDAIAYTWDLYEKEMERYDEAMKSYTDAMAAYEYRNLLYQEGVQYAIYRRSGETPLSNFDLTRAYFSYIIYRQRYREYPDPKSPPVKPEKTDEQVALAVPVPPDTPLPTAPTEPDPGAYNCSLLTVLARYDWYTGQLQQMAEIVSDASREATAYAGIVEGTREYYWLFLDNNCHIFARNGEVYATVELGEWLRMPFEYGEYQDLTIADVGCRYGENAFQVDVSMFGSQAELDENSPDDVLGDEDDDDSGDSGGGDDGVLSLTFNYRFSPGSDSRSRMEKLSDQSKTKSAVIKQAYIVRDVRTLIHLKLLNEENLVLAEGYTQELVGSCRIEIGLHYRVGISNDSYATYEGNRISVELGGEKYSAEFFDRKGKAAEVQDGLAVSNMAGTTMAVAASTSESLNLLMVGFDEVTMFGISMVDLNLTSHGDIDAQYNADSFGYGSAVILSKNELLLCGLYNGVILVGRTGVNENYKVIPKVDMPLYRIWQLMDGSYIGVGYDNSASSTTYTEADAPFSYVIKLSLDSLAGEEVYDGVADVAHEFTYETDVGDMTAVITGVSTSLKAKGVTGINIPEQLGSYRVIAVADGAFRNLKSLERAVIPSTVTAVGAEAFDGCAALKSVSFGSGVRTVGVGVFRGCIALSSVELGSGLRELGAYAFENCRSLEQIRLPSGLKSLNEGVFQGCSGLKSLDLGKVQTLGARSLRGCTALEQLSLPNTLTHIGVYAMESCTSLKSLVLPAGLQLVGDYALQGCKALETLQYSDPGPRLGTGALKGSGLKEFTLPRGMNTVPQELLAGCAALETLILHPDVTEIGPYALQNCSMLKTLELSHDGVWSYMDLAFEPRLQKLGQGALAGCYRLENLHLSDQVTELDPDCLPDANIIVEAGGAAQKYYENKGFAPRSYTLLYGTLLTPEEETISCWQLQYSDGETLYFDASWNRVHQEGSFTSTS